MRVATLHGLLREGPSEDGEGMSLVGVRAGGWGDLGEEHSRRGMSPVAKTHLNCRAPLSLEQSDLPGGHQGDSWHRPPKPQ